MKDNKDLLKKTGIISLLIILIIMILSVFWKIYGASLGLLIILGFPYYTLAALIILILNFTGSFVILMKNKTVKICLSLFEIGYTGALLFYILKYTKDYTGGSGGLLDAVPKMEAFSQIFRMSGIIAGILLIIYYGYVLIMSIKSKKNCNENNKK